MKKKKRQRRCPRILLLDKDDITLCCGSFTIHELCDKLNLTYGQLKYYMDCGNLFEDKYVLVEDV